MSMKNVAVGFKVTGVYPFDNQAIKVPEEEYTTFKPEALAVSLGIKYIPLYSPANLPRCKDDRPTEIESPLTSRGDLPPTEFSFFHSTPLGSRKHFETSLDYSSFACTSNVMERSFSESDIHCQSNDESPKCLLPLRRVHSLSKFLHTPQPHSSKDSSAKLKSAKVKSFGRVLMSRENMRLMEERETKTSRSRTEGGLQEGTRRKKAREGKW